MILPRIAAAALLALTLRAAAQPYPELAEAPLRQMLREAGVAAEDYPCVVIAFHAMSHVHRDSDREGIFGCALAIREKALGPDGDFSGALEVLGSVYRTTGRYQEAEALFKRALAIRERTLAPNDPRIATTLEELAWSYRDQGRFDEAEPMLRRALAIREKEQGVPGWYIGQSVYVLATVVLGQHRYVDAEKLFKRAIILLDKAGGPHIRMQIRALDGLEETYRQRGQPKAAEATAKKAARMRKDNGEPPSWIQDRPLPAARDNQPERRLSIAACADLFEGFVQVVESFRGKDHPEVAPQLILLAGCYRQQGRDDWAEELLVRARTIRERTR